MHLSLPGPHDHQDTIGAHDRRRRTTTTPALGAVAAQPVDGVLDVAQLDLARTAVEQSSASSSVASTTRTAQTVDGDGLRRVRTEG